MPYSPPARRFRARAAFPLVVAIAASALPACTAGGDDPGLEPTSSDAGATHDGPSGEAEPTSDAADDATDAATSDAADDADDAAMSDAADDATDAAMSDAATSDAADDATDSATSDAADDGDAATDDADAGGPANCGAGMQDNDGNGVCAPACEASTCSGHGTCSDASGTATCTCTDGYDGATCATCAGGVAPATWYRDGDGDGYGTAATTLLACLQPGGYVANATDCNDGDSSVHPGATESCGDGVDHDCSGLYDDALCCDAWPGKTVTAALSQPTHVYAGDLAKDGYPELYAVENLGRKVRILQNVAGVFGSETLLSSGAKEWAARAGDVDGDGDVDMVVTGDLPTHDGWYANAGTSWTGPTTFATSNAPREVVVADLDGDGDADIGAVDYNAHSVYWWKNAGGGSFGAAQTIDATMFGGVRVLAADVDHDGDVDLVASGNGIVRWYRNDGGETFTTVSIASVANAGIDVGDLDGDGYADDVAVMDPNNKRVVWYRFEAGAFGGANVALTGVASSDVRIGDLNGDGAADLVLGELATGIVRWSPGAAGSFGLPQLVTARLPKLREIALADLDGDGHLDVATMGDTHVEVALNPKGDHSATTCTCAAGEQDDDHDGLCSAACGASTCSGHGTCSDSSGTAVCSCSGGYTNASCDACGAGLQDQDEDGTCTAACAASTCSGHGTCSDASGTATCTCSGGYTGTTCASCPSGQQDNDGDGTCTAACAASTCSGHGTCSDASGTATCTCDATHAGTTCASCATGYGGADCSLICAERDVVPVACKDDQNVRCHPTIDGDIRADQTVGCFGGGNYDYCDYVSEGCTTSGCLKNVTLAYDLGASKSIDRVRTMSGWWVTDRTNHWQVWASDDPATKPNAGATLVWSGQASQDAWACKSGDPCTSEVPDACCPNGRDQPQDTSNVGQFQAKWDDATFDAHTARYWWVIFVDAEQEAYELHEVVFQSTSCSACAAGQQDGDGDGACAAACTNATCGGEGACSDSTGATACTCDGASGGAGCATECTTSWVTPAACTSDGSLSCSLASDGDETSFAVAICKGASEPFCDYASAGCETNGCVRDATVGFDLGASRSIGHVRFRSDWWSKRPKHYEIWVSDDPTQTPSTGATLVARDAARTNPWVCVTGDACTDEVPDACCPNGRSQPQDTSTAGPYYGKYDDAWFPRASGRYWYFVVRDAYYDPYVMIGEIRFEETTCP